MAFPGVAARLFLEYKAVTKKGFMMKLTIPLQTALTLRDKGALLVDARSPAEFSAATIPGAVNVPLLDDDQRREVGTLFRQQGKQAARLLGMRLVSPKIPDLVNRVLQTKPPNLPVVVFCWRGGMRSRTLTQLLDLAGIPARQISGGHKVFRKHVLDFFAAGHWGRLVVLRGLTGVGKTIILQRLANESWPVVDLEALANHRGSAFGGLGLPAQPSQKMFEAMLWDRLRHIPESGFALTEGESRHIGRVVQPARFFESLQLEKSLWIHAPLQVRIDNILADYPARDDLRGQIRSRLLTLKERLGKEAVDELEKLLETSRWKDLVRELMVRYYDPLYRHTLPERRVEVTVGQPQGDLTAVHQAIREILETPAEGRKQ